MGAGNPSRCNSAELRLESQDELDWEWGLNEWGTPASKMHMWGLLSCAS